MTAGLHIADFGNAISAPALGEREFAEATAPLPVFGLRGERHFSEKWSLRASGEFFVLEYGDFDGSFYDLYVGLDYQVMDRMAVGIGTGFSHTMTPEKAQQLGIRRLLHKPLLIEELASVLDELLHQNA